MGNRKIEGGQLIELALFNETHMVIYSQGEEALFENHANKSLQGFREYFKKKNVPIRGEVGLQLKGIGDGLILGRCGFHLI